MFVLFPVLSRAVVSIWYARLGLVMGFCHWCPWCLLPGNLRCLLWESPRPQNSKYRTPASNKIMMWYLFIFLLLLISQWTKQEQSDDSFNVLNIPSCTVCRIYGHWNDHHDDFWHRCSGPKKPGDLFSSLPVQ